MSKDGVLRIVSQSTRSQLSYRELAIERFVELLQAALKRLPMRKKQRDSRAAKDRRLEEKKQRSRSKSRSSEEVRLWDG